jgi:hypothetical protein
VNALFARALRLFQIRLRRIDVIKARCKLFVAGPNAKTVAVIVSSIEILAIAQRDSLLLRAGVNLRRAREQNCNNEYGP